MNEMEIRNKFLKGNRAKLRLAWTITIAVIIFTVIFSFSFSGEQDNGQNRGRVIDSAGILSDATIDRINEQN